MTRWSQVEEALDALLDLPEAARAAALGDLGRNAPELAAEVAALLDLTNGPDPVLDQPAATLIGPQAPADEALTAGAVVGPYRVLHLAGRGGSGEVYAAERSDGLYSQRVALKVLWRDELHSLARFEAERQILADLNDPRIARLLDAGTAPNGRPYLVLEWVDGVPITDWCRERHADLATRLRLFDAICQATGHAHQHLLVHRDLKPANVLVTADGSVKLLDFGAAKLLATRSQEQTLLSPMTPSYATPEQLSGQPVTTATDVYALGLLLFELLTDTRPFQFDSLSLATSIHRVLQSEAPAASATAAAAMAPPVPAAVLRGDLDAVIAKALRKDPAARYATVDALRDDLARWRDRRPVSARDGRWSYVLGRALRRHALAASAALSIVLALVVGISLTIWQSQRAETEARRATAVKSFLVGLFRQNALGNPDGVAGRQITAIELLHRGADSISAQLTDSPDTRAEIIDTLVDLYDQLEDFDRVDSLERLRLADLEAEHRRSPSRDRAQALEELGRSLAMRERYGEAEEFLGRALKDLDALGDGRSTARVQTLTSLGLVAYHIKPPEDPATARYAAAALELLDRYQPDSPDRLSAIQLLARALQRRGETARAEMYFRRFVELASLPVHKDDPAALGCALSDLGSFLMDTERYTEASSVLERAVDILQRVETDEQYDLVEARANRDRIRALADPFDVARGRLDAIVASTARVRSMAYPAALDRVAFAADRGTPSQASALLLAFSATLEADQAARNETKARAQALAARLAAKAGDGGRAREALVRSRAWLSSVGRNGNELRAMNLVSEAYLAVAGRHEDEARRLFEEAVALDAPEGVVLSAGYVDATIGLADLERSAKAYAAAERRARDLVAQISALPDPDWRAGLLALAQLSLGRVLAESGRPVEARAPCAAAVAVLSRLDEPVNPDLVRARTCLARTMAWRPGVPPSVSTAAVAAFAAGWRGPADHAG